MGFRWLAKGGYGSTEILPTWGEKGARLTGKYATLGGHARRSADLPGTRAAGPVVQKESIICAICISIVATSGSAHTSHIRESSREGLWILCAPFSLDLLLFGLDERLCTCTENDAHNVRT